MSDIPKLPEANFYTIIRTEFGRGDVVTNERMYKASEIETWHAEVFKDTVKVTGKWQNGTVAIPFGVAEGVFDTHKALLINIQPIKTETAEDILRDVMSALSRDGITSPAAYELIMEKAENFVKRNKK